MGTSCLMGPNKVPVWGRGGVVRTRCCHQCEQGGGSAGLETVGVRAEGLTVTKEPKETILSTEKTPCDTVRGTYPATQSPNPQHVQIHKWTLK